MSKRAVLDLGYVELVDHWGADEAVIRAARMSTNKGFQGWERDAKLLRYLYTNHHHTPFEMAGAVFEVKAPISVFREWHRHRTQSYNEMSARYIRTPDEHYIPTVERLQTPPDPKNKQTQGVVGGLKVDPEIIRTAFKLYHQAENWFYDWLLNVGVPRELARNCHSVDRYSKMRASANLRNWLGFLSLRQADNAQWEIRQYANVIHDMLSELYPRTLELYNE